MTPNPDDGVRSGRTRWLAGAAAVLVAATVAAWWPGCRQYPAVTSRQSLQQMKLLYAACNTRDAERLARVERGVEQLARQGKLSPAEREAFAEIVALARSGDWPAAERASFRFAEDQVGQGDAEPDRPDRAPPPKGGKPGR